MDGQSGRTDGNTHTLHYIHTLHTAYTTHPLILLQIKSELVLSAFWGQISPISLQTRLSENS